MTTSRLTVNGLGEIWLFPQKRNNKSSFLALPVEIVRERGGRVIEVTDKGWA